MRWTRCIIFSKVLNSGGCGLGFKYVATLIKNQVKIFNVFLLALTSTEI